MFRKLGIFYTLCRKLGIFYTLCRKLGIFYTLRLTPEAKTRTLIGFIAKKHCEEKNLSSEKIRHTSMVNSWKIKKIFMVCSNWCMYWTTEYQSTGALKSQIWGRAVFQFDKSLVVIHNYINQVGTCTNLCLYLLF